MTFHKSFRVTESALLWKSCAGGLFLLLASCTPPNTMGPLLEPDGILAKMKAACGGSAWDAVQGWHETGVADLVGRPGVGNEIWHDMRTLKTAMVNRIGGRVVRHAGFNGSSYWQMKPDGSVEIGRDPAKLRRHRRDAYLSSSAWFFPERFLAQIALAGRTLVDGAPHHVLRISPADADPFDLWVDAETYRVRRIIAGDEYAELSDYRTFGGICSATTGRQGDGNPANEIVLHVRTIETAKVIPAATFEPPAAARE